MRANRPEIEKLHSHARQAQDILGFREPVFGPFPNIQFNTVPHVELVQFIEKAISETGAEMVVTHHAGDPNNDHLHVARACCAAVRLFQRNPANVRVRSLYFMEVPSATDWAIDASLLPFRPDTYFDVARTLSLKLEALACYEGVMRPKWCRKNTYSIACAVPKSAASLRRPCRRRSVSRPPADSARHNELR